MMVAVQHSAQGAVRPTDAVTRPPGHDCFCPRCLGFLQCLIEGCAACSASGKTCAKCALGFIRLPSGQCEKLPKNVRLFQPCQCFAATAA
jgi:hypothetical protein